MLNKNNYDSNRTYIVKILLSIFFIVVVLFPLFTMLSYLFKTDVKMVLSGPQFATALKN